MAKRNSESGKRRRILSLCADLGVVVERLEWTPIGRGAEMQGPSGGWELDGSYVGMPIQAMAYNVAELIKDVVRERVNIEYRTQHETAYRRGVASAADEKQAEIDRLRLLVAFGGDGAQERNRWLACQVWALFRAMYRSCDCKPPMRQIWMLREIASRAFGANFEANLAWEPPSYPVRFDEIPESDLHKFEDGSPWRDLAAIRQAAETEDTLVIVERLRKRGDAVAAQAGPALEATREERA